MVGPFQFWEINLLLFRFQQPFTFFPWANLDEEIFSCANLNEDQFWADVCVRSKIESGNIIGVAWQWHKELRRKEEPRALCFYSFIYKKRNPIYRLRLPFSRVSFFGELQAQKLSVVHTYKESSFLLVPNNGYLLFSSPICISNCCWISRSLRFK